MPAVLRVFSCGSLCKGGLGVIAARRVLLGFVALSMVGLLGVCGSASAKLLHPFLSSFGSFSNVQGMATDAAGDVYVFDGSAGKVYKFDASGKPVNFTATATNSISGVGSASGGEGEIAVDRSASGPAKGDIYIAHAGGSVNIFSPEGTELGELTEGGHPWGEACGVATDPSGDVYVGLYSSHVNKYVPAANPVTNTEYVSTVSGLSGICNVAVDSSGNVFTDKWSSGPVTRYEPSQFGSLSATGLVVDAKGSSLAIDPSSNEVYVDEKSQIAQFGAHGEPFESPRATFAGSGEGAIGGSIGIAVGPSNHDVYVADGKGHVNVFGPVEEVPTASTGPASGITLSEATLTGSVDPEGVPILACRFEYGATTTYGASAPCPVAPGSATTPVAESVNLSGLEYGTEYHYRLLVRTAKGEYSGGDLTFETALLWPETITGLPDGRVYEQVSPPNKHGNQVEVKFPAFVRADGQAVMYAGNGALAEGVASGLPMMSVVSERTSRGWATRGAIPLPPAGEKNEEENSSLGDLPTLQVPSADLSQLLFATWGKSPFVGPPDQAGDDNIFLEGSNALEQPTWVGRPQTGAAPTKEGVSFVLGASPDLKTIYLEGGEQLLPGTPSGLYEYREGVLSDAGTLPGGETSSGKAIAVAMEGSHLPAAAGFANQVSADGSRIFFTRRDEAGTRELYAHTTADDGSQSTVLISQSQLPGHFGESAPDGPRKMPSTVSRADRIIYEEHPNLESSPFYAFASPDGSHALFQSIDRLTEDAPEDSSVKTYDFDLETGSLEYLPGVVGSIVTVSDDGSSAVFENDASAPFALERWTAGPGGGTVTQIAQLPPVAENNACAPVLCVGPAFTSNDGAVTVFATGSPIAGFNDGGSHYPLSPKAETGTESPVFFLGLWPNEEIFRYDSVGSTLSCLSCPPRGEKPSGSAILSRLNYESNSPYSSGGPEVTTAGRSASIDGSRVFFQTRAALVPQDTNGTSDVYEWEDGKVYLISSGHSPEQSILIGTSESSGDVFFETAEGIAPGDVAGEYDVYDARIPRPGDNPPPEAIPCTGAVCQGPPSVPQLLGQPASEAFNGAGNLTAVSSSSGVSVKSVTPAQKLRRALQACRRHKSARKRQLCEKRARRRYASKTARVQASHHNGRGK